MSQKDKKTYVLDTSVLIHDPESVLCFEDNAIVIPIAVLEELDNLKIRGGEAGYNAREAIRNLYELSKDSSPHDLQSGVELPTGGSLSFDFSKNDFNFLPESMKHNNDNSILIAAMRVKNNNPDTEAILVSKDINLRLKSMTAGVIVQDYEADKVSDLNLLYTGVDDIYFSAEEVANLCRLGYLKDVSLHSDVDLKPNKCFRVLCEGSSETTALARYVSSKDTLLWVNNPDFFVDLEDSNVKPVNEEQMLAYHLAMDPEVELLSLFGPPGTGKTMMALLAGLHQVRERYEKILIFRTITPIDKDIGYLPGDEGEKMAPWARPIISALRFMYGGKKHKMGDSGSDKKDSFYPSDEFLKYGLLEVRNLNQIRGDTFHNTFVIIDDAQNLTQHQMKAILTRFGKDSKYVLTADLDQIDSPHLDARSTGFAKVVSAFPGEDGYAQLKLVTGERHEMANKAARLL